MTLPAITPGEQSRAESRASGAGQCNSSFAFLHPGARVPGPVPPRGGSAVAAAAALKAADLALLPFPISVDLIVDAQVLLLRLCVGFLLASWTLELIPIFSSFFIYPGLAEK